MHSSESNCTPNDLQNPTHHPLISNILEQNVELAGKVTLLTNIVSKLEKAQIDLVRALTTISNNTKNILANQDDIFKQVDNLTHVV